MRRLAAFALLAGIVSAQDPRYPVDPIPFEWATTARQTSWPFGSPTRRVLRYQQVHDGMRGRAQRITALAIRRAPGDVHRVPAFRAEVSLRLSSARTTAATISSRFADNRGSDERLVLPRRLVSFPETAGPWDGPAPFADYVLPTTAPFAFDGRRPLCLEVRVFDHRNAVPTAFALHSEGHPAIAATGTACGGTDLTTTMDLTGINHDLTGLPPNAPVVMLFGVGFDVAAGNLLPLDLGPLGAPDCSLQVEPLFDARGFADSSGAMSLRIPTPTLVPGAFYGVQAVAVQPGVNALGAVLTQGNVVQPRTGRSIGRVWAEDLSAATGNRQPVFGLVIQVR